MADIETDDPEDEDAEASEGNPPDILLIDPDRSDLRNPLDILIELEEETQLENTMATTPNTTDKTVDKTVDKRTLPPLNEQGGAAHRGAQAAQSTET